MAYYYVFREKYTSFVKLFGHFDYVTFNIKQKFIIILCVLPIIYKYIHNGDMEITKKILKWWRDK